MSRQLMVPTCVPARDFRHLELELEQFPLENTTLWLSANKALGRGRKTP